MASQPRRLGGRDHAVDVEIGAGRRRPASARASSAARMCSDCGVVLGIDGDGARARARPRRAAMRMAISPRLAISNLWKDINVSVQASEQMNGDQLTSPCVPPHTPTAARYGRRQFLVAEHETFAGIGASGISFHITEFPQQDEAFSALPAIEMGFEPVLQRRRKRRPGALKARELARVGRGKFRATPARSQEDRRRYSGLH